MKSIIKRALVYGAERTIGKKLIERLKSEGYWVRGVDSTRDENNSADEVYSGDLTKESTIMSTMFSDVEPFNEVYQLTKTDSFDDSLLTNIYTLRYGKRYSVGTIITISEEKSIIDLYSRFKKEKQLNTLIIDIKKDKKLTKALDTIRTMVKKDSKKALKNLGNLKK